MQAKRLKLREEMAKKAAEEAADDSDVSVDRTAPANDDSDVSVNRDEENDTPMETNEEQALVPTEKEEVISISSHGNLTVSLLSQAGFLRSKTSKILKKY